MRQKARKKSRGAVLVEAGLVLPIIFMFLFGVFEYGRYAMVVQQYANAAREGTRWALANTQTTSIAGQVNWTSTTEATTKAKQKVTDMLPGAALQNQQVQVYRSNSAGTDIGGGWTSAKFGEYICVRITGNFQLATPALIGLPTSIPMDIRSAMRSEAN